MPVSLTWKTILVPHDFSASANHAAALARDQARLHGGKLLLLHVVELPPHFGPDSTLVMPPGHTTPIGVRHYAEEIASKHVHDLARRLEIDGVEVTPLVRIGSPVEEINLLVTEQQAAGTPIEVIVMGTHGRTGLRHFVAGSVAERVVRTSTVPVLTIRHSD